MYKQYIIATAIITFFWLLGILHQLEPDYEDT